MFSELEPQFSPRPFSFASTELLTEVLRAEIDAVAELLAKYPDLRNFLDNPEATLPQRTACFVLLTHRKLIDEIDDTLTARYEQPSLSHEQSHMLKGTYNLVLADAPVWALEMEQVVERLPTHIYTALPEPLRQGSLNPDNAEQLRAIESAKSTLSNVEQIQSLTQRVLDKQLQRLMQRWSAGIVQIQGPERREPKKRKGRRKGRRTRDKLRMLRDKMIAEIDDVAPTIVEFIKLMDERKVKPQPTWSGWPGSWVEAYKNPRLRELIHKDKSRALSRVRREHTR